MAASTFAEILKNNPYHDRLGRFTSAAGAVAVGQPSTLSAAALSKCQEIEKESVTRSTEQVSVVDDNGDVVIQKDGTKSHVSFGYEDIATVENKTITHNHPGEYGGTFSEGDISTFAACNAKSIRAVAKEGLYVLEKGDAEFEQVNSFSKEARKQLRAAGSEYSAIRSKTQGEVDAGRMSESAANETLRTARKTALETVGQQLQDIATKNGLIYSFTAAG